MFNEIRRLGPNVDELRAHHHETQTRIDELRKDVARLALLARSLADLCLEKGVMTSAQLAEHMRTLEVESKHIGGGLDARKAVEGLEARK
jgi:hypothetical protein